MGMIHGDEYRDSLRRVNPEIYYMGEKIKSVVDHPAFIPHVNAVALTYELAWAAEFEELLTTRSHLTGEKINFFTHVHHSRDDLVQKVKALRAMGQQTGSCFARCVGHDALNAIYSVTYDMDQKNGTEYHQRLINLLKEVQAKDLFPSGAMTDSKGDRGLSPSQQADPDQYVRIVERNRDGIVVRGAKVHITGAVNAHGHLVMPTTSMKEADADYAVCFYVPIDAPGLIHIFGRQNSDDRKCSGCTIDQGNSEYGIVGGEALVIFEDVFIPWENVFMCGEYHFTFDLVERFATAHRQNYGGCKTGLSDVLIGATLALAEAQGTAKATHIRDKLVEMVHLAETLYCCSIACSCQGYALPAGNFIADPLLANVTKLNVTRHTYEIARLAQDIAGGILATMPSEMDWRSTHVGKYVNKYMKGAADVPAETRIRLLRLIEGMTCGTALAESMHGAGSPQAQKIMMTRRSNWEYKKRLAQKLAKIKE
ncbi:MAG: 4-hydroxybutyryl-CoA dehydratase/vinylacetyl-CoA-Delta-isomerase [Chloroflexi bacterium]|nr:4-hydroxybutyryl-CoA dehydratase/vinylacetyl-CoA-Delta-isomerase [Chloroflexota bacterium]MBT9163901.1 4-hydroxybutyryl-CoA dehydratase/vinylacetyl-CoA-Delta-isomerase [Chloroflexota bacterium]